MDYSKLQDHEISALGMMMSIQYSLIIQKRKLGWGPIQCSFINQYFATSKSSNCSYILGETDEDAFSNEIFVHDRIMVEYDIEGDLTNCIMVRLRINNNNNYNNNISYNL